MIGIEAHGDLNGWVGLLLEHDRGARSEVSLCATAAINPHRAEVDLFGSAGSARVDCTTAVDATAFATMYAEFAAAARREHTPSIDVRRGLHIQRLLEAAEMQLTPRQ